MQDTNFVKQLMETVNHYLFWITVARMSEDFYNSSISDGAADRIQFRLASYQDFYVSRLGLAEIITKLHRSEAAVIFPYPISPVCLMLFLVLKGECG